MSILIKNYLFITFFILFSTITDASITLDRTRIIFPENDNAVNILIINEHPQTAYLVQSWIEDSQNQKLENKNILLTPPLQRIEAKSKSLIRLSKIPDINDLPQDRESLFYFNLRAIPPTPKYPNTLHLAIQSRLKLFYRPKSILKESKTQWINEIILTKTAHGYRLTNPTPFYITIIDLGENKKEINLEHKVFNTFMVPPKSSHDIISSILSVPYLTYINDYGSNVKLLFNCNEINCFVSSKE